MIRINEFKVPIANTISIEDLLKQKLNKISKCTPSNIKILRRSIDSRNINNLHYVYSLCFSLENSKTEADLIKKYGRSYKLSNYLEKSIEIKIPKSKPSQRPIIIGMGPAGLFAAYVLAINGLSPIIFERGEAVEDRIKTVNKFWEIGELNRDSNVQFGEGGAGTFSDGKLNTGNNDKLGYQSKILDTFVKFGAPENILYDSKPHIGTDILQKILINIRAELIKLGCEIHYSSRLDNIIIDNLLVPRIRSIIVNNVEYESNHVILAIGHSARDTYRMLYKHNISMSAKAFAVGLRVEHLQENINQYKYGKIKNLPTADYKLVGHFDNRSVFSFCMCPGGYVVNSSSQSNRLTVNGMSYSKRDSKNANSAIVVSVQPSDFSMPDNVLCGIEFQELIEEKAFRLCNGLIPSMQIYEFKRALGFKSQYCEEILPITKGSYAYNDITTILPNYINLSILKALNYFSNIIPNFGNIGVLSAVEARTSAPVRIERDKNYESNIQGIYPIGEGAGYAGGIMSACVDGLRVAINLCNNL